MMWCSINANWFHDDDENEMIHYTLSMYGLNEDFMDKFYKFVRTEAETELKKEQITNARKLLEFLENYRKDYAEEKERIHTIINENNAQKEEENEL